MHAGVTRLVDRLLARDAAEINSDWDGTLVIRALLEWEKATGDGRCSEYAMRWFAHQKRSVAQMSDEEIYATFRGPNSRIVRESPIPFTAYCGHWGLGYVCEPLERLVGDGSATALLEALADFILHRAARSRHGAVYHDDNMAFLIPDTCFFAAPILAVAARLTGREVYLDQAVWQMKAYADLFQDEKSGLAFTVWSEEGRPHNFWSRAGGWLAGALVGTLEALPKEHPAYTEFADRLGRLADGLAEVQAPNGDFHVLLDRPETPTDSTGPAMVATALERGVRLGVLGAPAQRTAEAAWAALERYIQPDGSVSRAYTGWAKSAVAEHMGDDVFDTPRDFVLGLALWCAALRVTGED